VYGEILDYSIGTQGTYFSFTTIFGEDLMIVNHQHINLPITPTVTINNANSIYSFVTTTKLNEFGLAELIIKIPHSISTYNIEACNLNLFKIIFDSFYFILNHFLLKFSIINQLLVMLHFVKPKLKKKEKI
jgi:hypothetical protein